MDRREVLKGLGLSLGYVIATPTVISILQSCKNETKVSWILKFFSENEGIVMRNLIDLILPATDNLPGANDVDVFQFIDAYVAEVLNKDQQDEYKKGMTAVIKAFGKSVNNINVGDYDALLAKFLKAGIDEVEQFTNNKDDILVYETLTDLRDMSIWSYKTSQKIGKEVLAYDPIPGELKGCISLEEATGGKAWSL